MFSNKVWVLESDNFIKGIIVDENTYISEEHGRKLNGQVWERCEDVQADMINLAIINDPQLLYNLSERYKKDQIFTYVGPTLIVINPFKNLNVDLQEYIDYIIRKHHNYKSIAPHTYSIAAHAITKFSEKTQAIVISGDSGAGKTENPRQCLNLLTSVNSEEMELSDKIMECNPILEAFGNAKTIRNKNSSRFGKYTRLFVINKYQIIDGELQITYQKKVELSTALLIGELQFDETNYGNTTPCNFKNEDLLKYICSTILLKHQHQSRLFNDLILKRNKTKGIQFSN